MMPAPANDTAIPTRSGEELDLQKLNDFLKGNSPELGTIQSVTQFPGGYSNLTYCIATKDSEYVLRRPPFGASIKSAHDMGREFKVLSTLSPNYKKTPKPIVYCESLEIIGSPFYIMERTKGVILRGSTAPKFGIAPSLFKGLSENLIDNLVALHALDIHATGLDQLGKPDGYVQRQVEGWTSRYYAAETDKLETMDAVAQWLKTNMPKSQSPAFLHNDYKYDNVVLNTEDLTEILGVLDWEMATVGDPLMDLGGTLAYWFEANDDAVLKAFNLTWLPGNLTRKEIIERYAEKSKRDTSTILFYYVFGLYKNSVIAQQIYARWKQGHTKDPRFGGLMAIIKIMAVKAAAAVNTQKI
jgi:aminoglycoside phosphotransferase (APT) family kinase protein